MPQENKRETQLLHEYENELEKVQSVVKEIRIKFLHKEMSIGEFESRVLPLKTAESNLTYGISLLKKSISGGNQFAGMDGFKGKGSEFFAARSIV